MRRAIWRLLLRARFVLWQHRRHDRLVIERGLGLPLVVLPGVLNPALFRSSGVVLEALDGGAVPAGATVLDLGTGSGVLAVAAAPLRFDVVVPKCLLKPNGAIGLDDKKWLEVPMTLEVLDDSDNTPEAPFGYYVSYENAA